MFGIPFEKSEFQELSLKLKDAVALVQTAVLLGDSTQPARQVGKWGKWGAFCWRTGVRWVSREGKWIHLLLPQRLMENVRALLSITHWIKDGAKLLNKVTQLWGDFGSMLNQILTPTVAEQTLQVESTKLVTRNSRDCNFLGFNSCCTFLGFNSCHRHTWEWHLLIECLQ